MNLLFPYMLLQKHAIILCHLIAITILKIESKFEYYQAGLESHLDQLAEVFSKEKETIIQFRVQPWLKSAILVGIE